MRISIPFKFINNQQIDEQHTNYSILFNLKRAYRISTERAHCAVCVTKSPCVGVFYSVASVLIAI